MTNGGCWLTCGHRQPSFLPRGLSGWHQSTFHIPRRNRERRVQKCVSLDHCKGGLTQEALKVIGTHNGTFHCDEALAVYMLRLTEAYRNSGYSSHTMDVAWRSLKAV